MTDEQNKRAAAKARNFFYACAGAQVIIYTLVGVEVGGPWPMRMLIISFITSAPLAAFGAWASEDAK